MDVSIDTGVDWKRNVYVYIFKNEWSLRQQVLVFTPGVSMCVKYIGILHALETQAQTQTIWGGLASSDKVVSVKNQDSGVGTLLTPNGPFTPSVRVNASTTLQWRWRYCSHWKQCSHSRIEIQPILNDSNAFNENSIASVIAELMLMLGVNGP